MANFPALSTGYVAQFPWGEDLSYETAAADMPTGTRYARPLLDRARPAFSISYSALTDAEARTLDAFFREMGGRFGEFSLTYVDNHGLRITYPKCRFDQDDLVISATSYNRNSCAVRILVLF